MALAGTRRTLPDLPQINWGHPLAQGLVAFIVPPYDLVSGVRGLPVGSGYIRATNDGVAAVSTSVTADGYEFRGMNALRRISNKISVISRSKTTANTAHGTMVGVPYRVDGTWTNPWQSFTWARAGSTEVGKFFWARSSSTSTEKYNASLTTYFDNDGLLHTHGFTHFDTGSVNSNRAFKDGVYQGAFTAGGTTGGDIAWPAAGTDLRLIVLNSGGVANPNAGFTGELTFAAIWNRPLSDSEHALMDLDPWQLLLDREQWVVPTAGGGGGATQPPRSMHQFRMRRAA